MKILSVSIAAYNVEAYLEETLKSFCIPEIMPDIEVLIVDDGSKDKTQFIARKYQERYPETFKYVQKQNGGHGSTVNKGIELAEGKYFKVVDGDDWVDRRELIKLINHLKNSNTDLVLTDFSRVFPDGSKKEEKYFTSLDEGKEYALLNMPRVESIAMHSITVKSELLKKNKVRLTEKCFYVDIEYVVYILNCVETAIYMPFNVYMYRYGTSDQSVNVKNMIKNIGMRKKVSTGLARFITDYKESVNCDMNRYELMKRKVVRMISGTCLVYLAYDDLKKAETELIEYESDISSISIELYQDSGKEGKVRIMRAAGHILFPLENRLYHMVKMKKMQDGLNI